MITFLDFWTANTNETPTIRVVTVDIPDGLTLKHNVDADDEAYCDLGEWVCQNEWLHELCGEVVDGEWCWDGESGPQYLANRVLEVQAW